MRKTLFLTLSFLIVSVYSSAQKVRGMNFSANISTASALYKALSPENRLNVKISLVDAEENVLFEECHTTACDPNGNFFLVIGEGEHQAGTLPALATSSDSYSIKVCFSTTQRPDEWIEGGRSKVGVIPVALYADKTIVGNDSILEASDYTMVSGQDTLFHLKDKADLNLFGATEGMEMNMGTDKKMWFSGDKEDGNVEGLINMHWTILASKPAITGLDHHGLDKYAIVAHYWSKSSHRAHQHISLEVDDGTGAQQTRFAFPWGTEQTWVRVHGNFRVHSRGNMRIGADSTQAIHYGHALSTESIWIGDTTNVEKKYALRIASKTDSASLDLIQGDESKGPRIYLESKAEDTWALRNNGNMKFEHNDIASMSLFRSGMVAIGSETTSEDFHVQGDVTAGHVVNKTGWLCTPIRTKDKLDEGTLMGLDTESGSYVQFNQNTPFAGIVMDGGKKVDDEGSREYRMCTLGKVKLPQSAYYVEEGRAYTREGNCLIGIALSDDYLYINPQFYLK